MIRAGPWYPSYSELRMAIRVERKSAENEPLFGMTIHLPGAADSIVHLAFGKFAHLAGFLFISSFITSHPLDLNRTIVHASDLDMVGRFIESPIHQISKGLNVRVFGVDPECVLAFDGIINLC